jgi:hypothetical protein
MFNFNHAPDTKSKESDTVSENQATVENYEGSKVQKFVELMRKNKRKAMLFAAFVFGVGGVAAIFGSKKIDNKAEEFANVLAEGVEEANEHEAYNLIKDYEESDLAKGETDPTSGDDDPPEGDDNDTSEEPSGPKEVPSWVEAEHAHGNMEVAFDGDAEEKSFEEKYAGTAAELGLNNPETLANIASTLQNMMQLDFVSPELAQDILEYQTNGGNVLESQNVQSFVTALLTTWESGDIVKLAQGKMPDFLSPSAPPAPEDAGVASENPLLTNYKAVMSNAEERFGKDSTEYKTLRGNILDAAMKAHKVTNPEYEQIRKDVMGQ